MAKVIRNGLATGNSDDVARSIAKRGVDQSAVTKSIGKTFTNDFTNVKSHDNMTSSLTARQNNQVDAIRGLPPEQQMAVMTARTKNLAPGIDEVEMAKRLGLSSKLIEEMERRQQNRPANSEDAKKEQDRINSNSSRGMAKLATIPMPPVPDCEASARISVPYPDTKIYIIKRLQLFKTPPTRTRDIRVRKPPGM